MGPRENPADVSTAKLRSPEIWELTDQIGSFIQYWGFKKVHGRIWAQLFLSREPLDAFDLRTRLGISKALVSLSVKDLLLYTVIREAGKSSRGTILYEANPNMKEAIFNVLRTRERKMMSQISAAYKMVEELPDTEKSRLNLSADRVQSLGQLIGGATGALEGLLAASELDSNVFQNFFGIQAKALELNT